MANGYTSLLAIAILVGIVLITRFILKNGSRQSNACNGNCSCCGVGCMSSFSPEKKDFDYIMGEDTVSRAGGEANNV